MTINQDYEGSSASAIRHWEVPYARLENTSPGVTEAAAMKSAVYGSQRCGTVLAIDAATSIAVIDFTARMVYEHSVRNVITYNGGAENTFREINIGDTIYYDRSVTMPANVFLSTSPLDKDGNANPIFGNVVLNEGRGETASSYPKGAAVASTQTCDVMQD